MKLKSKTAQIYLKATYILKNPLILSKLRRANYLNSIQTIIYLKETNKSLIRWGDGETLITYGEDIGFQKSKNDLQIKLNEIINVYKKESNFLLAVPSPYLTKSLPQLLKIGKLDIWWRTQLLMYKMVNKHTVFGDAFIFRPMSALKSEIINSLWDKNLVIFVHPSEVVYLDFALRFQNTNPIHIKISEKNAFDSFDDIYSSIMNTVNSSLQPKSNFKVLISAGPTAKVLVYRLATEGLICYDMGQYFKWKFYDKSNFKGI